MKQYLDLCKLVLEKGNQRSDRTETGTISYFGAQTRYDLREGFPLVTTKKMFWKGVVHELLWILSGDTNIKYLNDNDVHIWDEWADERGDLGPVYGRQWRKWLVSTDDYWGEDTIDQIHYVIADIINKPESRRHLVSSWNVKDLDSMALVPCHFAFQFYVNDGELSCQLYQRSADLFLGVPFNIASYALLTHLIAQVTDLKVGELIHTIGDAHIYNNHLEQIKKQLQRVPYQHPKLQLNKQIKNIDDFKFDDIKLIDYKFHPTIKGKVSI